MRIRTTITMRMMRRTRTRTRLTMTLTWIRTRTRTPCQNGFITTRVMSLSLGPSCTVLVAIFGRQFFLDEVDNDIDLDKEEDENTIDKKWTTILMMTTTRTTMTCWWALRRCFQPCEHPPHTLADAQHSSQGPSTLRRGICCYLCHLFSYVLDAHSVHRYDKFQG